ncbi:unnamed protein product [Closterium sp. Yama58-4]|nr:unnamed protein product [Closterium sp. Yama58-4]
MADPLQSREAGTMHINDTKSGFIKGALQEAERLRVQQQRQAEWSSQEVKMGENVAARSMGGSSCAKSLKEEILGAVHGKRHTGREVEIGGASVLHSPAATAAGVLLVPSIPHAAPSTPLQHNIIHGMARGVSVDVEAVDKEVRKGGERVEIEQQQIGEGKGTVQEGAKVVTGGLLAHTGMEGAAEGVGEDVPNDERGGKIDEVEEKEHGSSDGKEAERVEETVVDKTKADLEVQLADMEAEGKCLAAKEEEERMRAAERMRALGLERAQLSAARLRLKQKREPENQDGEKLVMGTYGGVRLLQMPEHSDGERGTKRRREVQAEHSESQTGADEAIASDGDGTEGAGKKGKVCVEPDSLGKVYGVEKPFKAGGFFRRKKGTAAGKFCSEQTVGGKKRNLGNFDSERSRNYSIAICWMAYHPDTDLLTYDMDEKDVKAWSGHLNLVRRVPTGVWSILNELHISRIEK